MPLSEHLYCVAISFKMTERVEQWMCSKFCVKVEHSSMKTIWMIQKASAMGNWWLAASSQQCVCSCIMSPAEFFSKTSNYPGDLAPLQPRFGTLRLLDFPNTKIAFEREETSGCQWDTMGIHWWWLEKCVKSQGAYFEGDWGVIVLCTMFLVFCIFFKKFLCFSYYLVWIPSGQT